MKKQPLNLEAAKSGKNKKPAPKSKLIITLAIVSVLIIGITAGILQK